MRKFLLFIFTFGIIISLYNIKAYAYSQSDYQYLSIVKVNDLYQIIGSLNKNQFTANVSNVIYFSSSQNNWVIPTLLRSDYFNSLQEAITYLSTATNLGDAGQANRNYSGLVTIKGITLGSDTTDNFFPTYDDFLEYINPPDPSWWDDIANEFERQLGIDQESVDPLIEVIYNFWDWIFGDDPEQTNEVVTVIPSPTPLPTPIPYQTVIVPDGNDGFEFRYKYIDPTSGLPTESPEPPEYNINWPSPKAILIPISGTPVTDTDSVQAVIDAIGEQDGEYMVGIESIGKSFSVLPVKWFAFLGIPAAIIIVAGIIKSLLG